MNSIIFAANISVILVAIFSADKKNSLCLLALPMLIAATFATPNHGALLVIMCEALLIMGLLVKREPSSKSVFFAGVHLLVSGVGLIGISSQDELAKTIILSIFLGLRGLCWPFRATASGLGEGREDEEGLISSAVLYSGLPLIVVSSSPALEVLAWVQVGVVLLGTFSGSRNFKLLATLALISFLWPAGAIAYPAILLSFISGRQGAWLTRIFFLLLFLFVPMSGIPQELYWVALPLAGVAVGWACADETLKMEWTRAKAAVLSFSVSLASLLGILVLGITEQNWLIQPEGAVGIGVALVVELMVRNIDALKRFRGKGLSVVELEKVCRLLRFPQLLERSGKDGGDQALWISSKVIGFKGDIIWILGVCAGVLWSLVFWLY